MTGRTCRIAQTGLQGQSALGGLSFPVCGLFCGQRRKPKFKLPKIVAKTNKTTAFRQKISCFVGLLSGFEPETSSLPTDWAGEVFCFPGLSCPFPSNIPYSLTLLSPLFPPARFPVWVTVWVSTTGIVGVGQLPLAVEWSHFALLETIKGYQNEGIEPPGGAQCSRQVALQVFGMGQSVFSASRNGGRTS